MLQLHHKLLKDIKDLTEEYSINITPRDVSELVIAVCCLSHQDKYKEEMKPEKKKLIFVNKYINFEKEIRLLSKRAALNLSKMNPRLRNDVVAAFERIDFYDKDFTDAMKLLKMI